MLAGGAGVAGVATGTVGPAVGGCCAGGRCGRLSSRQMVARVELVGQLLDYL